MVIKRKMKNTFLFIFVMFDNVFLSLKVKRKFGVLVLLGQGKPHGRKK